jgi:hypothetical protein
MFKALKAARRLIFPEFMIHHGAMATVQLRRNHMYPWIRSTWYRHPDTRENLIVDFREVQTIHFQEV